MSSTNVENRAYFTFNGNKYQLAGLVKDITFETGSINKHLDAMSSDGNTPATLRMNFKPTIQWTELVPTSAEYVKLIALLTVPGGVTIVIQPFIIGDTTPSGQATQFTNCVMGRQNLSFPAQDIEATRRIEIVATSYTEL